MGGCPAHPPSSSQSRPQAALLGRRGRGSGPSGPTNKCFRNGRQAAGGLTARGPSLFFGKALRPAQEAGLGGADVEGANVWSRLRPEREPSALLPWSSCRTQSSGRCTRRRPVAGPEPGHGPCASLGPCPRAAPSPKPFRATKEGEASSLAISPRRIYSGQAGGGRTRTGPPSPAPSRGASLAQSPAPYRFSPGWYWGSVDVK